MAIWLFDATFAMMGPLVNRGEGKLSYMSVTPVSSSPTGLFQSFEIILIEFVVLDMVLNTQGQLFRLENLERRVALGRVIRLHPDLPPTLVVGEGQPCY